MQFDIITQGAAESKETEKKNRNTDKKWKQRRCPPVPIKSETWGKTRSKQDKYPKMKKREEKKRKKEP